MELPCIEAQKITARTISLRLHRAAVNNALLEERELNKYQDNSKNCNADAEKPTVIATAAVTKIKWMMTPK